MCKKNTVAPKRNTSKRLHELLKYFSIFYYISWWKNSICVLLLYAILLPGKCGRHRRMRIFLLLSPFLACQLLHFMVLSAQSRPLPFLYDYSDNSDCQERATDLHVQVLPLCTSDDNSPLGNDCFRRCPRQPAVTLWSFHCALESSFGDFFYLAIWRNCGC